MVHAQCLPANTAPILVELDEMFAGKQSHGNKTLGELGENLATDFIKKKGYRILGRNERNQAGELDIVARKNGVLTFIEVKTMRAGSDLVPEDNMSSAKIKKFKKAAEFYVATHNAQVKEVGYQLDVITILISQDTEIDDMVKLQHFENIA